VGIPLLDHHDTSGHKVLWQEELLPWGHCGGTQASESGEKGAKQELRPWCPLF